MLSKELNGQTYGYQYVAKAMNMIKIKIQEISTQGCSHCARTREILEEEIKPKFPEVEIEYIDMMTERGQKMVQEYEIMTSPGVIVNGKLFSSGSLDKNKLIEKIQEASSK